MKRNVCEVTDYWRCVIKINTDYLFSDNRVESWSLERKKNDSYNIVLTVFQKWLLRMEIKQKSCGMLVCLIALSH